MATLSITSSAVVEAICSLYAPHAIQLSPAERLAFVGNCLALADDQAWMSEAAMRGLTANHRSALRAAGFSLHGVPLDELEKAGGSLRCCVAEIY